MYVLFQLSGKGCDNITINIQFSSIQDKSIRWQLIDADNDTHIYFSGDWNDIYTNKNNVLAASSTTPICPSDTTIDFNSQCFDLKLYGTGYDWFELFFNNELVTIGKQSIGDNKGLYFCPFSLFANTSGVNQTGFSLTVTPYGQVNHNITIYDLNSLGIDSFDLIYKNEYINDNNTNQDVVDMTFSKGCYQIIIKNNQYNMTSQSTILHTDTETNALMFDFDYIVGNSDTTKIWLSNDQFIETGIIMCDNEVLYPAYRFGMGFACENEQEITCNSTQYLENMINNQNNSSNNNNNNTIKLGKSVTIPGICVNPKLNMKIMAMYQENGNISLDIDTFTNIFIDDTFIGVCDVSTLNDPDYYSCSNDSSGSSVDYIDTMIECSGVNTADISDYIIAGLEYNAETFQTVYFLLEFSQTLIQNKDCFATANGDGNDDIVYFYSEATISCDSDKTEIASLKVSFDRSTAVTSRTFSDIGGSLQDDKITMFISSINSSGSESDIVYSYTFGSVLEVYNDPALSQISDLWLIAGECYAFTFITSDVFTGGASAVRMHGIIEILLNNNQTVGYNGYFDVQSKTNIVCVAKPSDNYIYMDTDLIHTSYCIEPESCMNKEVWISDFERTKGLNLDGHSYHSLYKSKIDISKLNQDYIACYGAYACDESDLMLDVDNDAYVECAGVFGCNSVLIEADHIGCWSPSSCNSINFTITTSNTYTYNSSTPWYLRIPGIFLYGLFSVFNEELYINCHPSCYVYILAPFAIVNSRIKLSSRVETFSLFEHRYSNGFSDLTIECESQDTLVFIDVAFVYTYDEYGNIIENYADQLDYITYENCKYISTTWYYDYNNSNYHNNSHHLYHVVENNNILDAVEMVKQLLNANLYQCVGRNENTTMVNIGYPLFGESSITSSDDFSVICCNGYFSCSLASSIETGANGNILCMAFQACSEATLIRTRNAVNHNANYTFDSGNILCLGMYSCALANLESSNYIMCAATAACGQAFILDARTLICGSSWYGCYQAVVRSVNKIYVLAINWGMTVYSNNIGETWIYLLAEEAGYELTYFCDEGDICHIICGAKYSCDNTTQIYCNGKCDVSCYSNETCPKIMISTSPTLSPTDSPTDLPIASNQRLFEEKDLNLWFNWIVGILTVLVVIIAIIAIIDARYIRINELFTSSSIIVALFYANDFISDVFFCLKVCVYAFIDVNNDSDDDNNKNRGAYVILFFLSLTFIILPLTLNVIQLYFELSKWQNDVILKQTQVKQWINTNVKLLYFLAVMSGSSFSAISLCNSHLFKLKVFGMGLPRYYQSLFQSKRFLSIVVCENLPQLLIQAIVLVLSIQDGKNTNGLLITIFAMIFTIVSIILSSVEFAFASRNLKSGSIMSIEFTIESIALAKLNMMKFNSKIVFSNCLKLRHIMSKRLHIPMDQIDRLLPLQVSNGVVFRFIIDIDPVQCDPIIAAMNNAVEKNFLARDISKVFRLRIRQCVLLKQNVNMIEIRRIKRYSVNDNETNIKGTFSLRSKKKKKRRNTIGVDVQVVEHTLDEKSHDDDLNMMVESSNGTTLQSIASHSTSSAVGITSKSPTSTTQLTPIFNAANVQVESNIQPIQDDRAENLLGSKSDEQEFHE